MENFRVHSLDLFSVVLYSDIDSEFKTAHITSFADKIIPSRGVSYEKDVASL